MDEFFQFYEEQYPLALFNKIRYEVEDNGGPQPQLLQRKVSDPTVIHFPEVSNYKKNEEM